MQTLDIHQSNYHLVSSTIFTIICTHPTASIDSLDHFTGATPFKDHFADILQDALVKLRWISPSRKPSPLAQPDDPPAWLPGARLELENPSESCEMASLNSFYRPKMRRWNHNGEPPSSAFQQCTQDVPPEPRSPLSEPDGPTTTASEPEGRKDTPTLTDGVNNVAFYDSTGKTPSSGFKQCKQDVPPELKSPPSEPDSPTTNASDAESQKITQLTSEANQFPIPTDKVDLATSGDAANLEVDLKRKPASAHDLISKLNSNEETSEIGDHIDSSQAKPQLELIPFVKPSLTFNPASDSSALKDALDEALADNS
jgi:hypothetical protein